MVQHKSQLKKQQKRGVDFKKIKRKIGRKLPPPKNTTNTEVKSKAIVLPEQSLASEKTGLAVSKKGLTLKELLQQTSHHNAKVRRDALMGIRDIFLKHPTQLKMHRLSVIEKLRERMSDEDKMVRETLYQLLKTVIFPASKEDNLGTFISLMMAYIFNAMTHLAIDVRLMAFKFFDLLVQHYPMSFSMYADKIIQHYKEILQKNQFNLHDKGKLKSVLAGLAYCLSLLPSNNKVSTKNENVVADRIILHSFDSQVHEHHSGFSVAAKELKELLPILVSGFQDFIPSVQTIPSLETQSYDCVLSILKSIHLVVKFFDENTSDLQKILKKLFHVFPLNPTHQSSDKEEHRYFVLNVIVTEIFFCLNDWSAPPSVFLEKFLVFIVEALSEKSGKAFFLKHSLPLISFIPKLSMQVDDTWKSHILQAFTEVFEKCDSESSMKLVCLSAIKEMLFLKDNTPEIIDFHIKWIRGICCLLNDKNPTLSKAVLVLQLELGQCCILSHELDNMQYSLREFYSTCQDGYIPFMKVDRDIQELCVSCLYYFSFIHPSLLQSIAAVCLCPDLDPYLLFRLLEVLDSCYKAGHIQIVDYISFLITLLARYPTGSSQVQSRSGLFNSVCSYLSQIGDHHLVFKMVEGPLIHQISNKAPLENTCWMLRTIIRLDSEPTRISQETISKLGNVIPGYLMDIVSSVDDKKSRSYYVLPCFVLLYKSEKLLNHVMTALIDSSAAVDVFLLMHQDVKIWQKLSSYQAQIDSLLHSLMSDEGSKLRIEEKHKIQCAYDQLKMVV